ncbi:hypothetical protein ACFYO2_32140 [Streptomyces sp. NPDC006602]|uniref:hypothetical protein n=1 Tax=Streptomyces sp. NPDC006602 TaxID=3364751 RepID=UPI0036BFD8B1
MAPIGQTATVPQTVLPTDGKAVVLAAKCRISAMSRAHQDADSPAVRRPVPSLVGRVARTIPAIGRATATRGYGRAPLSLTSLATDRGFAGEADLRDAPLGTAAATVCTADTLDLDSTPQDACPAGLQPYGETWIADGMLHVQLVPHAFGAVKIPLLG